jgi:hypothetical protein
MLHMVSNLRQHGLTDLQAGGFLTDNASGNF